MKSVPARAQKTIACLLSLLLTALPLLSCAAAENDASKETDTVQTEHPDPIDAETGPATVRVEVSDAPISVTITFMDHGVPYDPLQKEDPDITLSAEERGSGGLGIFMVKKTMDEITYEYKDGQNILRIRKDI